jgi:molybdopterin-synthase adenylyltransferase
MSKKSVPSKKELNDRQIQQYSRQILLSEIGSHGQEKLLSSTVGVIGAGGLGCPTVQMLASTGVGHIKLFDADTVDLSNLPRQILHYATDVDRFKVESIKDKISKMNPDVQIEAVPEFITPKNIEGYLKGCDYVIEASDNMGVKFLTNDCCVYMKIPFTIAGVVQFFGQVISVIPGQTPCYRCLYRVPANEDPATSCSGAGVISTVPSFAGILQANEAIKGLLNLPGRMVNRLFLFDLWQYSFDFIDIKRNPKCPTCHDLTQPFFHTSKYDMGNRCELK